MFVFATVVALAVASAFVSTVTTASGAKKGDRKRGIKVGETITNDKPTKVWYWVCKLWDDNVIDDKQK